ncbi:hypothetical protein COCNU_04G004240 [Cocos nucifera]|uniref:Uncharacterized protein n=1 Tax=Cocos nucifera TaxID=13894 RepID=A0A8K0MZY2_COCNU|nr:hypothetical protein COCNU_04G004240 [Cocos nucifera]
MAFDSTAVMHVQRRADLRRMDPAMECRSDGGCTQIRQGGMRNKAGKVAQGLRSSSRCKGPNLAVASRPDPAVAPGSEPARWRGPSSSSRCAGSNTVEQGSGEATPRSGNGGPRTVAVTCRGGDLVAAALGSSGRA